MDTLKDLVVTQGALVLVIQELEEEPKGYIQDKLVGYQEHQDSMP